MLMVDVRILRIYTVASFVQFQYFGPVMCILCDFV